MPKAWLFNGAGIADRPRKLRLRRYWPGRQGLRRGGPDIGRHLYRRPLRLWRRRIHAVRHIGKAAGRTRITASQSLTDIILGTDTFRPPGQAGLVLRLGESDRCGRRNRQHQGEQESHSGTLTSGEPNR